jgi:hypothetical protein
MKMRRATMMMKTRTGATAVGGDDEGKGGRSQPSSVAAGVRRTSAATQSEHADGTEMKSLPNLHGNHRFLPSGKNEGRRGTPYPHSIHRVHTLKTLSQEIMLSNAKSEIVVSIDKNIYYSTQKKLISCGILSYDPSYTSQ